MEKWTFKQCPIVLMDTVPACKGKTVKFLIIPTAIDIYVHNLWATHTEPTFCNMICIHVFFSLILILFYLQILFIDCCTTRHVNPNIFVLCPLKARHPFLVRVTCITICFCTMFKSGSCHDCLLLLYPVLL